MAAIRLVVFGPPASGKGVQARRLAAWFDIPHVSSGANIRRSIERGDPEGIRPLVEAGEKVDDEVVERIVAPALEDGFVLDGYPRTVEQARRLDDLLARRASAVDAVIELRVDESTLRERMLGRAAEEHRADDRLEVFEHRLDEYRRDEPALRDHFADRLAEIDGEGTEDEVFERILEGLAARSP